MACRGRSKALGHRLALVFVRQTKVRSVPGIPGTVAMTMGIATASGGGGNGTWPEVAQLKDFPQQGSFLALQSRHRIGDIGHKGHDKTSNVPSVSYTLGNTDPQKQTPDCSLSSRTPASDVLLDVSDYYVILTLAIWGFPRLRRWEFLIGKHTNHWIRIDDPQGRHGYPASWG